MSDTMKRGRASWCRWSKVNNSMFANLLIVIVIVGMCAKNFYWFYQIKWVIKIAKNCPHSIYLMYSVVHELCPCFLLLIWIHQFWLAQTVLAQKKGKFQQFKLKMKTKHTFSIIKSEIHHYNKKTSYHCHKKCWNQAYYCDKSHFELVHNECTMRTVISLSRADACVVSNYYSVLKHCAIKLQQTSDRQKITITKIDIRKKKTMKSSRDK